MTMTKVKTAELVGAQLDWAVAIALGWTRWGAYPDCWLTNGASRDISKGPSYQNFHPSVNWRDGGPILDREKIGFKHDVHGTWATHPLALCGAILGNDMLEAAMRAFVASRLGDVVEVPEMEG